MGVASLLVAPILIFVFFPFYRRLGVTTSFEYIGHRFWPTRPPDGFRTFFAGPSRLARRRYLFTRTGNFGCDRGESVSRDCADGYPGHLLHRHWRLAAVLWTDMLQFVILTGGAVWVAATLVSGVPGGLEGIMTTARESGPSAPLGREPGFDECQVVLFSSFFNLMQDYGADQVSVQRLMSTRTFGGMAKATLLNALF